MSANGMRVSELLRILASLSPEQKTAIVQRMKAYLAYGGAS